MFFTKKFDADAEGTTSVAAQPPATPSIVELMAKSGIVNESSQAVATPIEIPAEAATQESEEAQTLS